MASDYEKKQVEQHKTLLLQDIQTLMQELQDKLTAAEADDFKGNWAKLGDLNRLRTGLRETLGYDD